MLLEDKKAWKRLEINSRRKIKIAHCEDEQEKDMLRKESSKRRLKRRDMEDVRKFIWRWRCKTQDGSTVLTFTQFAYNNNISFTHKQKNPVMKKF